MIKKLIYIAFVFVLSLIIQACSSKAIAPKNDSIVGLWTFREVIIKVPFKQCSAPVTNEYTSDGKFTYTSGEQIITGTYEINSKSNDRMSIEINSISDNNKNNCQGLSAEHVRNNTPTKQYFELQGDNLLLCLPMPMPQPCLMRFSRN